MCGCSTHWKRFVFWHNIDFVTCGSLKPTCTLKKKTLFWGLESPQKRLLFFYLFLNFQGLSIHGKDKAIVWRVKYVGCWNFFFECLVGVNIYIYIYIYIYIFLRAFVSKIFFFFLVKRKWILFQRSLSHPEPQKSK